MSQIHQLQVRFEPLEDRALMRIRTRDEIEYRFWLTRRFVKVLWPMLGQLMQADETVRRQADPSSKSAVLSFQHEAALSQSDFQTPFADRPAERPLGETPTVLSHVRTGTRPDGTRILAMHPPDGQGIEIALDPAILHSLVKLIGDAATTAQWGLDVAPGASPEATRPERVN